MNILQILQEIIKNPIVIVVWINAFVEITAILLLLQYAPQYFYYVLGYDKVTTGVSSFQTRLLFRISLVSDLDLPRPDQSCYGNSQ